MSPVGDGLSGGDRIFIELARSAIRNSIRTTLISWKAGFAMCKKTDLLSGKNLIFLSLDTPLFSLPSFFVNYLARIAKTIMWSCSYQFCESDTGVSILYSASDFWMDVIPSCILKIRYPHIRWVGTFYLAAPNPLKGYKEGGRWRVPSMKGIIYWCLQLPMYWLIRRFSQFVFVTSEPEKKRFPKQTKENKIVVIKGGVNLDKVHQFQKKIGKVQKIYDGVFIGRFHPQKGVLELVEIWNILVKKLPSAKLIMIGDGPQMGKVKEKIRKLHLEKNIELTGYLIDGLQKYTIFAKSKIVVHPAIYDSGGMAAAEAMAWGMPGVSFNLDALKTYYPKGMIKCPLHNKQKFALIVLSLLKNKRRYFAVKNDALDLITNYWDWSKRASEGLRQIFN